MVDYGWTEDAKRTGESEASEQETAEIHMDNETPIEDTPADGVGPTPEARANLDRSPSRPAGPTDGEDNPIARFFNRLFGDS